MECSSILQIDPAEYLKLFTVPVRYAAQCLAVTMSQSSESIPDSQPDPFRQLFEYPEPPSLSLSEILGSQDSQPRRLEIPDSQDSQPRRSEIPDSQDSTSSWPSVKNYALSTCNKGSPGNRGSPRNRG